MTFKNTQLSIVKQLLIKDKYIKLVHVNVKQRGNVPPGNIHPNLKANISQYYYPFFALFKESDFYNFTKKLNGYVMGAQYNEGILSIANAEVFGKEFSTLGDKIVQWAKDIIDLEINSIKTKTSNISYQYISNSYVQNNYNYVYDNII
jgi:hypothetical protein